MRTNIFTLLLCLFGALFSYGQKKGKSFDRSRLIATTDNYYFVNHYIDRSGVIEVYSIHDNELVTVYKPSRKVNQLAIYNSVQSNKHFLASNGERKRIELKNDQHQTVSTFQYSEQLYIVGNFAGNNVDVFIFSNYSHKPSFFSCTFDHENNQFSDLIELTTPVPDAISLSSWLNLSTNFAIHYMDSSIQKYLFLDSTFSAFSSVSLSKRLSPVTDEIYSPTHDMNYYLAPDLPANSGQNSSEMSLFSEDGYEYDLIPHTELSLGIRPKVAHYSEDRLLVYNSYLKPLSSTLGDTSSYERGIIAHQVDLKSNKMLYKYHVIDTIQSERNAAAVSLGLLFFSKKDDSFYYCDRTKEKHQVIIKRFDVSTTKMTSTNIATATSSRQRSSLSIPFIHNGIFKLIYISPDNELMLSTFSQEKHTTESLGIRVTENTVLFPAIEEHPSHFILHYMEQENSTFVAIPYN